MVKQNKTQKVADIFEKARKIESRVSTDEDLKLSDTLRYYMRDTTAAKNLLYRRLRCLANYEAANRALEKARAKNKDVHAVSSNPVVGSVRLDFLDGAECTVVYPHMVVE